MAAPKNRPDLGEMYTPEAVAEALHIGKATVYRLIHSGELKAVKVGNQFRIPDAALHEYLNIDAVLAA
jgi:excisionase family DNA binding protein